MNNNKKTNKTNALREAIRKEIKKSLNEAAYTQRQEAILTKLDKTIEKELKYIGYKTKLPPDALRMVSLEWLNGTIMADTVQETLSNDMYDNDNMHKILSKYDKSMGSDM